MRLTVYRQSFKTRADGTIVYKGEDARPYVDDQLFFVADGLGGAASIRHQSFREGLFDSETLLDTLFAGVYEDYNDERFVKYVTDSFFELFAVKDCYTDNINNLKKSGYFASRIVTAILLHEMLYQSDYSADAIFKRYAAAEAEGKTEEVLRDLGNHFKQRIQDNLRKIAANANLVYESSYSGLALLGSTLCATIYRETEDAVEAIYLTAGDSRPYVWNGESGLCQLLADQEGKDGGMTNYIRANEDADFDIRCHYFQFTKPCVLFNASDGCFDSGKFVSQLAFEKLILESSQQAEYAQQLADALTDFFVDYGRHDDSSTIAMKFFGFDGFDGFKEAAAKRLAELDSTYLQVMPDLLDADYVLEYEECARTFPAKLSALKGKFEAEEATVRYCGDYIRSGQYAPFEAAIEAINAKIDAEKDKVKDAKVGIDAIIAQNFVKFLPTPTHTHMERWSDRYHTERIYHIEARYHEQASDYMAQLERYKREFDRSVESLSSLLEQIYEIGVPEHFEDFDAVSYQIVENCEQSMDELFSFFASLKAHKQEAVKRLTQQRRIYIERNVKLAQKYPQHVKEIRKMLESGNLRLEDIALFPDDKQALRGHLDWLAEAYTEMKRLSGEAKEEALHKAIETYWTENYSRIISEIVADDRVRISESLRSEADALLHEMHEQTREIREKSELQSRLFARYDTVYCQYLGGVSE